MMQCEFNVKSCFYTLIMLAVVQNFVRAADQFAPAPGAPGTGPNTVEIKNEQEFRDHVLSVKNPVIIQFHAPWCAPCKALTPFLEKAVNEQNGQIKLVRVDIALEELGNLAKSQGIRSVPILVSYMNGKIVDKMIGLHTDREVNDFVKKQMTGHAQMTGSANRK